MADEPTGEAARRPSTKVAGSDADEGDLLAGCLGRRGEQAGVAQQCCRTPPCRRAQRLEHRAPADDDSVARGVAGGRPTAGRWRSLERRGVAPSPPGRCWRRRRGGRRERRRNAAQSASSPGLPCPKAPTSSTLGIGDHLLVQLGRAAGHRRPAAGRKRARRTSAAARRGRPAMQQARRAVAASDRASTGTVITLGAPAQRPSGGDSRTGVRWARARASAPLDENGRGIREHGDVGGAEPRCDVVVGDPSGERRDVAVGRRQLGGEAVLPAQPWMVSSRHDDVDAASGVACRVEDDLDALVGSDEAETQDGEPAIEPETPACVAPIEWRNLLDAVGDHRRRRDDPAERRLVDDRRRAGPHDGRLYGGDPGAGDRGREPRRGATWCSRRSTAAGSTIWCIVVTSDESASTHRDRPRAPGRPSNDLTPPYRNSSNWRWTTGALVSAAAVIAAGSARPPSTNWRRTSTAPSANRCGSPSTSGATTVTRTPWSARAWARLAV